MKLKSVFSIAMFLCLGCLAQVAHGSGDTFAASNSVDVAADQMSSLIEANLEPITASLKQTNELTIRNYKAVLGNFERKFASAEVLVRSLRLSTVSVPEAWLNDYFDLIMVKARQDFLDEVLLKLENLRDNLPISSARTSVESRIYVVRGELSNLSLVRLSLNIRLSK